MRILGIGYYIIIALLLSATAYRLQSKNRNKAQSDACASVYISYFIFSFRSLKYRSTSAADFVLKVISLVSPPLRLTSTP